jgi:hypothetical protein
MPRGMIGASPMPQYGMPMNGQMPPPPPMMPPMPPMPPQPPRQQGGQQATPQQADPWAGGINPSLTALLPPQEAAPGYSPQLGRGAPPAAYAPATYSPPPVGQPPVQPTPIAAPGWGWPPATAGVPIDQGALAGVPARQGGTTPTELQELVPAEATLTPWRRTETEAPRAEAPPQPQRAQDSTAQSPVAVGEGPFAGLSPWPGAPTVESYQTAAAPQTPSAWPQRQPAPMPPGDPFAPVSPLPQSAPSGSTLISPYSVPPWLAPTSHQPTPDRPAPAPSQPDQPAASPQNEPQAARPEPLPYFPTLAPANPPPVPQPPAPPSSGDGTYSTRSMWHERKNI